MAYSDEPVLVTPARRWSVKSVAAIVFVLALVGGILAIPLYQHVLDDHARDARRGPHQGALYDITVNGVRHTIELGWTSPAFSVGLTPAPAAGATLEVSGDFGREVLAWNKTDSRFGPGKLTLDPYSHHKMTLALRQDGRVLWRDTLWAYGVIVSDED